MEREKKIRSRVYRAFCFPREHFSSEDEWNNYLEQREDIAFNLVEGCDVAETEAKLKKIEQENAHLIAESQAKEVEMQQSIFDEAAVGEKGTEDAQGTKRMSYTTTGNEPDLAPATERESIGGGVTTMQIRYEEETPEKQLQLQESSQKQKRLALLASGWSHELVRKRAIQEAFDTFVFVT